MYDLKLCASYCMDACRERLCPPGIKLSKESIPNSTIFVDPFAPTLGLDAKLTRQHGGSLRCLRRPPEAAADGAPSLDRPGPLPAGRRSQVPSLFALFLINQFVLMLLSGHVILLCCLCAIHYLVETGRQMRDLIKLCALWSMDACRAPQCHRGSRAGQEKYSEFYNVHGPGARRRPAAPAQGSPRRLCRPPKATSSLQVPSIFNCLLLLSEHVSQACLPAGLVVFNNSS